LNLESIYYFCRNFLNIKPKTMKKIFAILAIAGLMTACNNSVDKEKSSADSTSTMSTDTTTKMSTDTASKMMADTTHKADTSAKK